MSSCGAGGTTVVAVTVVVSGAAAKAMEVVCCPLHMSGQCEATFAMGVCARGYAAVAVTVSALVW